jgi:hypothetical protein
VRKLFATGGKKRRIVFNLADAVMEKIDGIIGSLNNHAELEILSYAA